MQVSDVTTLVSEAFLARLLPMYDEVTLNAIRSLRMVDYPPAAIVSAVGALAASAVLYAVGIWLRRLPKKVSTDAQQERVAAMRAVAHEWLPWLLILSASPVGGILIMAAGFFAIRPWKVALMLVAAEIAWRAAPVL